MAAKQPATDKPNKDTAAADQPTADSAYTVLQQRDDRLVVRLPNRLIVIAQRVPAAPVVSAQVWVKTGSIYEQQHVGAGLSHFLEHLVAGGSTSQRSESQSNAILGRIGGQTNAATSLDTVRYYINTTAEHAPQAVELLSDWLEHNQVKQSEFEREKQVIQREFAMGQADPGRIFWKLTQRARYETHPARHPTIGYLNQFLEVTRNEVQSFHDKMYVPNNMVFTVVGDIDPRAMVDQIAGLWSESKAGDLPQITFPEQSGQVEPVTVTGHADIERPRVRLIFPNVRLGEPGDYELDLLAKILGEGESSRLVRKLRDQMGLVTRIEAFNYSAAWGKAFFGIEAELSDKALAWARDQIGTRDSGEQKEADDDQALSAADQKRLREKAVQHVRQVILDQLKQLRSDGVTAEELKRAKREVLSNVVQSNQTAQAIASRLARDTIGQGDPDYLPKYAQRVQSLTRDDLRSAADRFLTRDRAITVVLAPPTPDEDLTPMTRLPEDAQAEDVPQDHFELDNRRLIEQLEQNKEADEDQPTIEVDPVQRYTLDNGLRLLIQRSTVVPAASIHLYRKGGLLADTPGKEGLARAAAIMAKRGTDSRSAQDIARTVDNLGASLTTSSGNSTSYVRASALKEDIPTMLELVADVTLHPSFNSEQWDIMQPRQLAAIDRQTESIWGEVRTDFREAYFGDHPWAANPTGRRKVVEQLTVDDLRRFHKQNLNASNSVLAVVGDVQPEKIKARVEDLLADMPVKADQAFDPPVPSKPDPRTVQRQTAKPGTAIQLGFGPGVARSDPDYPELTVLARVLSDFPSGYLEQALRGQGQGLVYGVHAGNVTGLVPGYFAIVFNTQPKSAAEALSKTRQAVERLRSEKIAEKDLVRAKAKVLTNESLARQSNSGRAAEMALDTLYGINDPGGRKFLKQVRNMDLATIQQTAQQYLTKPVIVCLSRDKVSLAAPDDQ